ncbi:outer membrane lipoprotein chaperone LolA [Methylococcus capsulatus]|jgi:outer membrane lipoprotein carrier protein|uniref:Outer-membrane lipoprotein carrier protein n=1 Tax=Methylococcus capsulatus TaxID=414 RepID=A0AA35Y1Y0_METCP|nr:outer membrane lipoprotein chaperone LolA [Methylococcus capsulatus]CAI8869879.1 Outer-membrane lipoprotein carrier protein [Methylococcus capsulatus]
MPAFRYLIVLPLLCWGFASLAETTPQSRLKSFLDSARTLQADFTQVRLDESGRPRQESGGSFYLQRPGKFRWDYTKPYRQQIVSSGGKVWFYDVDLEQVTAKRLGQAVGSTPALLLSGEMALEDNFTIEDQGTEEGMYWIKLVPKSEEGGFRYVLIGLEGDKLAGMELSDNFGQLTRIYFANLRTGITLDPKLFQFSPPAGVDVFEDK